MAGLAAHWQAKKRATLLPSSRLCNPPRYYLVKRQTNRVIYSLGLFMRGEGWGWEIEIFLTCPFLKVRQTVFGSCC